MTQKDQFLKELALLRAKNSYKSLKEVDSIRKLKKTIARLHTSS